MAKRSAAIRKLATWFNPISTNSVNCGQEPRSPLERSQWKKRSNATAESEQTSTNGRVGCVSLWTLSPANVDFLHRDSLSEKQRTEDSMTKVLISPAPLAGLEAEFRNVLLKAGFELVYP